MVLPLGKESGIVLQKLNHRNDPSTSISTPGHALKKTEKHVQTKTRPPALTAVVSQPRTDATQMSIADHIHTDRTAHAEKKGLVPIHPHMDDP